MNTVQASIAANTYVISGPNEAKSEYILSLRFDNKCAELSDLLPGIMNQLGPDNIDHLKQLADNLSNSNKSTSMGEEHDDGDEDVPDLVENFEDVSKS